MHIISSDGKPRHIIDYMGAAHPMSVSPSPTRRPRSSAQLMSEFLTRVSSTNVAARVHGRGRDWEKSAPVPPLPSSGAGIVCEHERPIGACHARARAVNSERILAAADAPEPCWEAGARG
jgi:hypothetical protein